MIVIGILILFLLFVIACGIASIDKHLGIIEKNQIELIRVLKNSK